LALNRKLEKQSVGKLHQGAKMSGKVHISRVQKMKYEGRF
jgi:hypothetical protein